MTRRCQYAPRTLPVRTPPPWRETAAYIQLFAVVIYGTRPVFDYLIKWDEIGESRIAEKGLDKNWNRQPIGPPPRVSVNLRDLLFHDEVMNCSHR